MISVRYVNGMATKRVSQRTGCNELAAKGDRNLTTRIWDETGDEKQGQRRRIQHDNQNAKEN